jgi:hypothetical protein
MSPLVQSLLLAAAAAVASAKAVPPSTGADWISLENGMEFQPSKVSDPVRQRALRKAQARLLEEEAQEAGKQTSFVDCHGASEERHRRNLNSGDGENACQRYLLWAAVSPPMPLAE